MAKDIVDVAIEEIGYAETGDNQTKYGAWFGMNGAPWCHMFVSWCANQAGVSSCVAHTASCSSGISWFQARGEYKFREAHTPKRGDIIYFGGAHVGIVEYTENGVVHTIEGNSSNKVGRRAYPLRHGTISGYGVPSYPSVTSSGGGGTGGGGTGTKTEPKKTSAEELAYLKRILGEKTPKVNLDTQKYVIKNTGKLSECSVSIIVKHGNKTFSVPVFEDMRIVWERKGSPGKLTFQTKYNKNFNITEGDSVLVVVDKVKMFYGFVFTRKQTREKIYSYTVYDQLRYLKNKDTIIYKNLRADQLVELIAKRFGLQYGELPNTEYAMSAIEDDATLFDMIENALDNTLMTKNQVYVLYDDVGKLQLKNISDMRVPECLVDAETGEDYNYTSTIDSNVYNQIKLVYENTETGTYDVYIAKSTENINKWGVLQYLEKIDAPDVGELKSQAYLKLYNQKQKTLSISGVIGNKKVRAGSLVPVMLNLDDGKIINYMLVDRVSHTFNNREHQMELKVSGGDYSAE